MKKLACAILTLSLLVGLPSCSVIEDFYIKLDANSAYYKSANWNCDAATFEELYCPYYRDTLKALFANDGIQYEEIVETTSDANNETMRLYGYNETHTMYLSFVNDGEIGFYRLHLYYYGNEHLTYDDSAISSLLEIADRFTNAVAFDTKTDINHFKRLYSEAQENQKSYASFSYHHDSVIGTVGYYASLDHDAGYYYRMRKDTSVEKPCYYFRFEGLLKPVSELETEN